MGCDIHSYAEKRINGNYRVILYVAPFDERNYRWFGFLADVRNYSAVPPIAEPRGLPDDVSDEVADSANSWGEDAHTHSWLTLAELEAFDYARMTEDRRYTQQVGPNVFNGGATAAIGQGTPMTFRTFLGEQFFWMMEELKRVGAERIVFWFDN